MGLVTEQRESDKRRPRLERLRSAIAIVALLTIAGSWIAIQIQTACETATRDAFLGFAHALNAGDTNAGDAERAEQFFADGSFSWYSEDPYRLGDDARNRESLDDYLRDRVEQDARLRVLFFDFNSEAPPGALGHFGFYAVDESWQLISGKGAALCESGELTVLSMGSG